MGSEHPRDQHPVVVRLEIRARPGEKEKLLQFLRQAFPFYEAPGGIEMRLLQQMDDPDSFIEEVRYRSAVDYERDNVRVESDSEMKQYLDRWRSMLAGRPEVTVYRDVTADVRGTKPEDE